MNIQVTKENLSRAINNVARVASSHNTLPILANIALKTTNNRLSVSATNLDIAITHLTGAKVSQEGSITIPAKLTQDLVSSLPSDVINLKLDGTKLQINADQYSSTINGISTEDFPVMPEITATDSLKISTNEFKTTLSQVVGAASSDELRPILTGVYFGFNSGKFTIAATDSYRLAEKITKHTAKIKPLIIPARALAELIRILPDDKEVILKYSEQQINFSTDDIELTTRLIDGKYPAYQNLIPTKFSTSATITHTDLTNIVKVSSLFARESAGSITINVDEETGKLSIHSIASQLGENTAEASADASGSGSITLNSRYLLDALSVMSGAKTIFFGFNGKLEPIILKDPNDPNYTYVIMPLKS